MKIPCLINDEELSVMLNYNDPNTIIGTYRQQISTIILSFAFIILSLIISPK